MEWSWTSSGRRSTDGRWRYDEFDSDADCRGEARRGEARVNRSSNRIRICSRCRLHAGWFVFGWTRRDGDTYRHLHVETRIEQSIGSTKSFFRGACLARRGDGYPTYVRTRVYDVRRGYYSCPRHLCMYVYILVLVRRYILSCSYIYSYRTQYE